MELTNEQKQIAREHLGTPCRGYGITLDGLYAAVSAVLAASGVVRIEPPIFLAGAKVAVEHERYTGEGVVRYDTGVRRRMIGVLLGNGNVWEYEAETVRLAAQPTQEQSVEGRMNIGDLRRRLFAPFDCPWNGLVRDFTAASEEPGGVVEPVAVMEALIRCVCDRAHLDNSFPDRHHIGLLGLFGSAPASAQEQSAQVALQSGVGLWMLACFGEEIWRDKQERNHRFLEESLELVQCLGCTISEAHQLVDYVFHRPEGDPFQEVGGVLVTLAAMCNAQTINMNEAGKTELARIWTKIEKIREKQAAKLEHSPLAAPTPSEPQERVVEEMCMAYCAEETDLPWMDFSETARTYYRKTMTAAYRVAEQHIRAEIANKGVKMTGAELISQERQRQIDVEGWTPTHDEQHEMGELAAAAMCYAEQAIDNDIRHVGSRDDFLVGWWPFAQQEWKPSEDQVRNLAKAGALIAAEIDRRQRFNKG